MKFFRMIKYDFVQNSRRTLAGWMLAGGLGLLFFLYFFMDVLHVFWSGETLAENLGVFREQGITAGDGLLYLTGGMLPVSFESLTESFPLPVRWLLTPALILFFTLNYARADLTHGGIQVLTRTRNRVFWWLAKCIWNSATVLSCFAAELLVWIFLTGLLAKPSVVSLNPGFFEGIFHAGLPKREVFASEAICVFCLLPALVCAAVSLLQMTLTLYMKPVFAYMITIAYYIAGIYYAEPLFLSNYALSARSSMIGLYYFRPETGFFLCAVLGIAAAGVGGARICRMDLLSFD